MRDVRWERYPSENVRCSYLLGHVGKLEECSLIRESCLRQRGPDVRLRQKKVMETS